MRGIHLGASGASDVVIKGGSLGIGTTSPSSSLEIDGGTSTTLNINSSTHNAAVANESKLQFSYGHSGSPSAVGFIKLTENSTNSFDGTMTFAVPFNNGSGGSSTRNVIVIKNDGKVGIGNPSPESTLSLSGSQGFLDFTRGNAGDSHWYLSSDSNKFYIGRDDILAGNNVITFVSASGNVGIGTTSPQALLHVEGALSASGQITAADIIPYADDTEFLGGSANRWRVLYATRIQTDILREADGTNVLGMTGTTRDLYGTDGNVRISFEDDITFTNGDLVVPEYIYHGGDTNTFIRFQNDDINLTAGGSNLFRVDNTAPVREIVVNEAGAATNFRVESDTVTAALFVTASNRYT